MSNVLSINAGSSSLKFQLIEMPEENVIAKGLVERIGLENAVFSLKYDDKEDKKVTEISDHGKAVEILLERLKASGVIKSLAEIDGIGHRVVHGGEKFSDSVIVTDEIIAEIENVSELAPLHNPANLMGIKAFK